jgi:NADPH-dependent ferric siderophore reductase
VEEPGEIVTLLWPAPGRELVLPREGWRFPPGVAEAQHCRNYTVRRYDPAAGELDIDFVVHGDHGPASRWAAAAAPGDSVGYAGPRTHWTADPAADWTLLIADETGLPALAAIAETLPPGHPAIAVVEVADAREEQPLPSRADLEVRWLHRDGAPAGPSARLEDAVRALALPPGRGRAWGAGEAHAVRGVRRYLCAEAGLGAAAVSVLGYWKHRLTAEWE